MTDRLSPLDVSFLYMEGRTTPMHGGEVAILETPPEGFDYDRLITLLEQRISLVPRYRQKVRFIPGRLAGPVWVDDRAFDITYHVRRSALPRPGSSQQLHEFVARIQSRPLDRSRPLWEMYLVEGLADDRVAIVTKSHNALVDGVTTIDIAQVILDSRPSAPESGDVLWMPEPEPSSVQLLLDSVVGLLQRPSGVLEAARLGVQDVRSTTGRVMGALGGVAATVGYALKSAPPSPLNTGIGEQRRYATAVTSLEDYRRVRTQNGSTVNDVILATVAGALRGWLLFRGAPVTPATTIRAMVPVSVRGSEDSDAPMAGGVTALFVDLPIGEPNPLMRLAQVSYATKAHKDSGMSVDAQRLASISGFAPPTLQALGSRAAGGLARRMFNLVVVNVPGPQMPLYAAGARMSEIFPIVPLVDGQAVSVGVTSYDGGVYYGLNADRDSMPDVDVLASLIQESLEELVAVSGGLKVPHNRTARTSARSSGGDGQ